MAPSRGQNESPGFLCCWELRSQPLRTKLLEPEQIPWLVLAVPHGEHLNFSHLQVPHGKWGKNGTNLMSQV